MCFLLSHREIHFLRKQHNKHKCKWWQLIISFHFVKFTFTTPLFYNHLTTVWRIGVNTAVITILFPLFFFCSTFQRLLLLRVYDKKMNHTNTHRETHIQSTHISTQHNRYDKNDRMYNDLSAVRFTFLTPAILRSNEKYTHECMVFTRRLG